MYIALIRHGEAACNLYEDDDLLEKYDREAPLTARGREQARLLALHFPAFLQPFQVIASPLPRAAETAQIFMQSFQGEICYDPRLEELRTPAVFPTPLRQWQWDALLENRLQQPEAELLSGLESLYQQSLRVKQLLTELLPDARKAEPNFLLFSHGFTIELALLFLLKLELTTLQQWRFKISNTALHIVEYDNIGRCRLIAVNNRHHLNTF